MRFARLIGALAYCLLVGSLVGQTERISQLVSQADEAFADENRALARKLYLEILDLNPEQSHSIYRLGELADSDRAAATWFERYVAMEPDDAWGWLALGNRYLRLGKAVEARAALRRAAKLAPEAKEVRPVMERAIRRAAPVLEPLGGFTTDSDGNRIWTYGLSAEAPTREAFRIGARLARSAISDGFSAATLVQGAVRLQGQPRRQLRLDFNGGLARLGISSGGSWSTPIADLRMRWAHASNGSSFEIRGARNPLGTTPLLIANRAMRDELRVSGSAPVGPLRVRAGGRIAEITSPVERSNRRLQEDGALVLPMGWRGEFSAQYHRIGYQRASAAGYFAPKSVDTVEGGTYWEIGGDGRWSAEIDLGAGLQRLARQNEAAGAWKPALRAWGTFTVDLTRAVALRSEMEAYSAPFAPVGVSTAPNWRYATVSFGLLLRLYQ